MSRPEEAAQPLVRTTLALAVLIGTVALAAVVGLLLVAAASQELSTSPKSLPLFSMKVVE